MPQIFPMNWFFLSLLIFFTIFSPEKNFFFNNKTIALNNNKNFYSFILTWKW